MEKVFLSRVFRDKDIYEIGTGESDTYLKNLIEAGAHVPCFRGNDKNHYEPDDDVCYSCIFLRDRRYYTEASKKEKLRQAKAQGVPKDKIEIEKYQKVEKHTIYCLVSEIEIDKKKDSDVGEIKRRRKIRV